MSNTLRYPLKPEQQHPHSSWAPFTLQFLKQEGQDLRIIRQLQPQDSDRIPLTDKNWANTPVCVYPTVNWAALRCRTHREAGLDLNGWWRRAESLAADCSHRPKEDGWCNTNMMSLLQTWSQSRSCWRNNPQKDPRVILCSHYIITTFIYISVFGGEGGAVTAERAADKHRLWNVLRVKDVCGQSNWSSHHINIIQTNKGKGGIEIFWYLFSVTDWFLQTLCVM